MMVYEVYDCAAHISSDILSLARSFAAHCFSLAIRRLVGMQCSSNIASIPGIDIPRSAAPPKRTLARCRASRHAVRTGDGWVAHPHSWSKFSFPHLMLTSVAPCAVLPLHPARPRRRGLNKVQRTDGAAREWLSWLWEDYSFIACMSQRPASRHSKHGAYANPRRRFAAERV